MSDCECPCPDPRSCYEEMMARYPRTGIESPDGGECCCECHELVAFDICDNCGGDGEFDEPAARTMREGTFRCQSCKGTGFVSRTADEAGKDWLDESATAIQEKP